MIYMVSNSIYIKDEIFVLDKEKIKILKSKASKKIIRDLDIVFTKITVKRSMK